MAKRKDEEQSSRASEKQCKGENGIKSAVIGALVAVAMYSCLPKTARADAGIVVYGPKGIDARRTESGHIALIVTDLCAKGISQLRECALGEPPGVVITNYPSISAGRSGTVMVVPVVPHFYAVDDVQSLPVLTSGSTLRALQVQYWRTHLKSYLPALSQESYKDLVKQQSTFRLSRIVRGLLTLDFLKKVFDRNGEETIALNDPLTKELIPSGYWREAIGTEHVRNAIVITLPAGREEELKLVDFIERSRQKPFKTLSNNCSDFVKRGLLTVFGGRGMRFRNRLLDPSDIWTTTPLLVATSFIDYANRERLPLGVSFMPILAGTGRPTAPLKSIARGALVPSPSQGKLAFALKLYINSLNPLIGTTAFAVDKSSRFADLDKLVHERDRLFAPSVATDLELQPSNNATYSKRERVVRFGTSSCWKAKQREFAMLTAQATEVGRLTKAEQSELLSLGRPFLLPRFYEKLANARHPDGPLMSGVQSSLGPSYPDVPNTASRLYFLPPNLDTKNEMVPNRLQIRAMAQSIESRKHAVDFRLMISVINYDLASEPKNRRLAPVFDRDWHLLLDVAEQNGLSLAADSAAREGLEECSSRESEKNIAVVDAIQQERAPLHRMSAFFRQVVVSPVR
jgi:hypothetical protein